MPPIPVHIDDPITPQKPSGTTPQTAESGSVSGSTPASNPATTTAAAPPPSGYPPAQPGAAVPAPTPYGPAPQQQPTRTTEAQLDGPPPPQPGAVPVPFSQQPPQTSTLPPPPKAGQSVSQQGSAFTAALNQMHMPPPQQNFAPTHSTDASTPQRFTGASGPTTLNMGPVGGSHPGSRSGSVEHPAGYQQNVYAQELNPAQRASLEQETRREGVMGFGGGEGFGGVGGGGGGSEGARGEEGSMWNTAKSWLGVAGNKLAETEEEVWKRINGK